MSLSVKVISYKRQPPRILLSMSFDRGRSTVGRSPTCNLCLPDPDKYISRQHAVISYENGLYYLSDTSKAGTFFADNNQKVHGDKIQLKDGTVLRIGDYELLVSLTDRGELDTSSSEDRLEEDDSFFPIFGPNTGEVDDTPGPLIEPILPDDPIPDPPQEGSISPPDISPAKPMDAIPSDFNPIDLLIETGEKGEFTAELDNQENYIPKGWEEQGFPNGEPNKNPYSGSIDPSTGPRVVKGRQDLSAGPTIKKRTPEASKRMQPHSRDAFDNLLNVFLKAAGIEDPNFLREEQSPDLMRTVGAMLRELVAGLMTVLKGRAELKAQVRVPVTILKPTENNPLKFTPGVNEALKLLLTKNHSGYLDAVEAVREGYEDIMHHQLAITAGVRASLLNVFKKFDPQQFEEKYQEGIVLQKRAKCWDSYSQAYKKIISEASDDFFGNAFTQAYEDQLLKLRTKRTRR